MSKLTIFKEISSINVDEQPDNVRRMYEEINNFIFSGRWTNSKKTLQMLPYINDSASVIAKKLGISENNVLASRSQASEKLRKFLGKNLHEKILSQDEDIYKNFRIGMQSAIAEVISVDEVLPLEQLNKLCTGEDSRVFELQDCEEEIRFLASISITNTLHKLKGIDREKLNFIMGVLNKPNHYKVKTGSRVKNDDKFQILGQVLYLATSCDLENDDKLQKLSSNYDALESEYQRLKIVAKADHARAKKEIEDLKQQIHGLLSL